MTLLLGKARRLKQAKEEAQDEIEKYRQEREKQFREFEAKVTNFRYTDNFCSIFIKYILYDTTKK